MNFYLNMGFQKKRVRLYEPITRNYKYVHPLKKLLIQFFRFALLVFVISGMTYIYCDLEMEVQAAQPEVITKYKTIKPEPTPEPIIDDFISEAVDEFLPEHKSEATMILHCLAHRESGHGKSNKCGDSGRACGPMQFWQETWVRMRKQMIEQELADEISDRHNTKEAVRTTAWAIANGHAHEWGPIARFLKGSNFAVCQAPSWQY